MTRMRLPSGVVSNVIPCASACDATGGLSMWIAPVLSYIGDKMPAHEPRPDVSPFSRRAALCATRVTTPQRGDGAPEDAGRG